MIIEKNLQEMFDQLGRELRRMQYPNSNIISIRAKCQELEAFALSQGAQNYNVDLGFKFLRTWYPINKEFKSYADLGYHTKIAYWTIGLLNDFLLHGIFTTVRNKRLISLSNEQEKILFEFHAYQLKQGYADNTARRCCYIMRSFLLYLEAHKINMINICEKNIVDFLSVYIDKSKAYISTVIVALKRFGKFMLATTFANNDIGKWIPPITKHTSFRVPSIWDPNEIDRLLASVDRGNSLGKRDYAILLLAAKLGLRSSDIKNLKFGDINWEERQINIIQRKTLKPLSLPLPKDVGWAIIDYIKNGRPKSELQIIFLRHAHPIGPFPDYGSLSSIISRYRTIAGIDVGDNVRKGMHSLRHTFASKLLREGIPIETIAEMLGHVGMRSVDVYLSVETKALRKCALSPEEVYKNV